MSGNCLTLGKKKIGKNEPCFIVAEVGINHNGDLQLARELVAAAAEAGADSVKFQNYRTAEMVGDRSLSMRYWSKGKEVEESQYDLFIRNELSFDDLSQLSEECAKYGIIMHSTPMGLQGLEELLDLDVPVLKNGSDCLSHLDLITAMGETGLPTVLATGMATAEEIDRAVRWFRATGNEELILLHCTSSYPAPSKDVNLARIPVLGDAFSCLVGLSDHSLGTTAAVGAVYVGACWIEKHFTLDNNFAGPDHWFSITPTKLSQLVTDVREAEQMMGSPRLGVVSSEEFGHKNFRLSCAANRDLKNGDRINSDDIRYLRPGTGFPPYLRQLIEGRYAARSIEAGEVFTFENLS
jgi:N-acetylneuraminate synthase/N,N'-diacetyllegionaminate synthase